VSTRWFVVGVAAAGAAVLVQTAAHLAATLPFDDVGSIVDLDRSNSLPDVLSTAVIALAAVGAVVLATRRDGFERIVAWLLAAATALVAGEDLVHTGLGGTSPSQLFVLASAALMTALIFAIGSREGARVRWSLLAGVALLVAAIAVGDLDQVIPWLERDRGERIAELQIVAKQGLELAGWALVSLAIWDAALRRSSAASESARPTASRRPAASRRRAA